MHYKSVILIALLTILCSCIVTTVQINSASTQTVDPYTSDSSGDWPMYLHDAAHTSTSDNVAPLAHDLLWTFDTHKDPNSQSLVGSSPAIVNGVVYIGSDDGDLFALNAYTGALIWNRTLGDLSTCSPAVVDGVVYASVWEGKNYALNASNGDVIWSNNRRYSGSSPAVVDGVFYISESGNAVAINATTGEYIWRYSIGTNGGNIPIVADGSVFISDSGYVFAINASTGELRWSRTFRISNTYNSPAYANDVLYFECSDELFYALNATDGSTAWSTGTGYSADHSPAVADGKVIVPTSGSGVSVLDAATGERLWKYAVSPGMGSSCAVAGGNVYVAGNDGNIVALDINSGAKVWSYPLSNTGTSSSPAVANGILYIRGVNGVVYAFGKSNQASVSVSPTVGLVGTTHVISVSGSGFSSGAAITAIANGSAVTVNNAVADSVGHFSGTVTFNPQTPCGLYTIAFSDGQGNMASTSYVVAPYPSQSWPMFMQNPQRTGTADNSAPIENKLLWKFDVDNTGSLNSVTSSAAVAGGIVYDASQNGYLYALDASTGTCFWRYNCGDGLLASPVVVDGVVYIGNINGVNAIDAYKGTLIWKTTEVDAFISTPAVSGGMLYVGSFAADSLCAFRVSDGQLVWRYVTGDYVNSSPVVAGDTVYVSSDDHYLYALDAATGALRWRYNCNGSQPNDSLSASPVVANNVVYVTAYDGNVYAIDTQTGEKIWNHTTARLSSTFASPAYSNGVIYQAADKALYALNASTGDELWQFTSTQQIQACPAVAAGVVYIGGNDGILYALNASSGSQVWQYNLSYSIVASASVANGVVYLGARNGSLYAIGAYQSTDYQVPPVTSTPTPTPAQTANPSPTNTPINDDITSTVAPTSSPTTTPKETQTPTQSTHPTEKSTPQPQQQNFMPLLIAGGIGGCAVVIGGLGLIRYNRKKASKLELQKEN
jgi:outer membrane protein assembly factor BamB